jgi:hypothetical protein
MHSPAPTISSAEIPLAIPTANTASKAISRLVSFKAGSTTDGSTRSRPPAGSGTSSTMPAAKPAPVEVRERAGESWSRWSIEINRLQHLPTLVDVDAGFQAQPFVFGSPLNR